MILQAQCQYHAIHVFERLARNMLIRRLSLLFRSTPTWWRKNEILDWLESRPGCGDLHLSRSEKNPDTLAVLYRIGCQRDRARIPAGPTLREGD
jgi:hypothetical protein